jgi:inorganic pyrophosphatase
LKNKKVNTIIQGSFENSLFIGKDILIYIDRPIGSKHPQHHFEYLLNYGYVPNTKTDDGEELDAYILGISYPLDTFCGKVIAMIHRTNDADDKLIVTNGQNFTNEQIYEFTYFQEQYFQSEIIRTQRPIYTI